MALCESPFGAVAISVGPQRRGRARNTQRAADGDRDTGKLIVLSPGGCRYAEFRNGSPDAFAVAPADCDLLGRSVDPTGALGGQATSRIEAIGKYFRRQP